MLGFNLLLTNVEGIVKKHWWMTATSTLHCFRKPSIIISTSILLDTQQIVILWKPPRYHHLCEKWRTLRCLTTHCRPTQWHPKSKCLVWKLWKKTYPFNINSLKKDTFTFSRTENIFRAIISMGLYNLVEILEIFVKTPPQLTCTNSWHSPSTISQLILIFTVVS